MTRSILLLDDDPLEARLLRARIGDRAVEIMHRDRLPDELDEVPDMILLDHDVDPKATTADAVRRLRDVGFECPIFLYSNLDANALPDVDLPRLPKNTPLDALIATLESR